MLVLGLGTINADECVVLARQSTASEGPPHRFTEDLAYERALARAGDTGDDGQTAEWKAHVEVFQVVLTGAADLEKGDII